MTKIIVDDIEIDVPADYTLLQACEEAGAEIPRFCFHERLSVAGNCRMCLVEVKGAPKPVPSCSSAVSDLRPGPNGEPPVVSTKSQIVKSAREGTMELILINHPLDCPICDQGGQCDLQDQAMAFGLDKGRFTEGKHSVDDKNLGCLIKTSMNRCITCTRCVRFITEVAGVPEIGALWRGEDTQIQSYLQSALTSELQGNLADLCPVGALTHKPEAFAYRSWELTRTNSVDVMDAVGSAISVDTRGRAVMRISPRINEDVNEEWISDKSRYIVDGLKVQRLDRPYIRIEGQLVPTSWEQAFSSIAAKVQNVRKDKIGALVGDLSSLEEIYALKLLMSSLGSSHVDCRQDGSRVHTKLGRSSYIFNPAIAGIEEADALLIIGSNPRLEAPIINARIRKRWLKGDFPVAVIGEAADLTYDYQYLGQGRETLLDVIQAKNSFNNVLKNAKKPIILVGQGAISSDDGEAVLAQTAQLAHSAGALSDEWNGFAVLNLAASRVGALDLGFVPDDKSFSAQQMAGAHALDIIFNLGADELDIKEGAFVVYIGTHGDKGAHRADVILPGAAYTEKSATFVNTEGRPQLANRAAFPPGDAREDWAILRALSEVLGHTLPFDSLGMLRQKLFSEYPLLGKIGSVSKVNEDLSTLLNLKEKVGSGAFISPIKDFYFTNPVARASKTMAECSAQRKERSIMAAE